MYFPENMNFQYFFFDTYPGYFLEALPIAILATVIWYLLRYRSDRVTPKSQKLRSCIFVCYMAGLLCLVLFFKLMQSGWYTLLYHRPSSIDPGLFQGGIHLIPDFYRHINSEVIGNLLMFLPFGILYPLAHPACGFSKTLLAGGLYILGIEILQPVFGRAFDVNDIVMNSLAVITSSAAYFRVRKVIRSHSSIP